ncbi:hypothetical protein [Micromonospora purpureochromogenes]|uniref:SnoaL-like domain-containing protein n=1 Tax=Micromonospora purpureochromogenes TaxID=47872 RepID=A0ABX2RKN8_9ACTN|nr:hypothetical protein [Micromonospora purpureochromogenes]NYF55751.1 hypothetical protein [Micromonospora purpureochromogenes]
MTDALSAEQAVVALLTAMRTCRQDLERFVVDAIWLGYDWPGEVLCYGRLDVGWGDEPARFEVFQELRMIFEAAEVRTNELYLRVRMEPTVEACRVESMIEAHLDVPMGRCGEGAHVLHRHVSAGLALPQALDVLPDHLERLYRYDGWTTDLGLRRP